MCQPRRRVVTTTGKSDDDGNSHARRLTPVDRTGSTIGAPLFETTSMPRAQRRSVDQPQRSKEPEPDPMILRACPYVATCPNVRA